MYKHTTPSNKVYIGITKQKLRKRWSYGSGYANNQYFKRSIVKYGWNNIRHNILYIRLNENEAKYIEKRLIRYYKSNDKNYGYNITSGGEATSGLKGKLSARSKSVYQIDLKSKSVIRKWDSIADIKREYGFSDGGIVDCCSYHAKTIGGFAWAYNDKNFDLNKTLEFALKPNGTSAKKVYQIDINTHKIIKEWSSVMEISKTNGFTHQPISACCRGIQKLAHGYIWCYVDCLDIQAHIAHALSSRKVKTQKNYN